MVPESTTTTIGASGGTAKSADGILELAIPAGALSKDTQIMISKPAGLLGSAVLAHDQKSLSPAYVIAPQGLDFGAAAELRMHTPTKRPGHSMVIVAGLSRAESPPSVFSSSERLVRMPINGLTKDRYWLLELGFDACEEKSCGDFCTLCDPGGSNCATPQDPGAFCNEAGRCVQGVVPACVAPISAAGWNDPPGSGPSFVISAFAIAHRDVGFDLHGDCDGTSGNCVDNLLSPLGDLMNDQILQGLLGGESLILIELAGFPQDYRGDTGIFTLKLYAGVDANDPPFPPALFHIPPGHTKCCELKIHASSVAGNPVQAMVRVPARVERGRLFTVLPGRFRPMPQPLVSVTALTQLERLLLSARLPSSLAKIEDGLLGGAVPINGLAQTPNPYCRTTSPRCTVAFSSESTLLDLTATLVNPQPDIDLDGKGREGFVVSDADGTVQRCCAGNGASPPIVGNQCAGAEVAPLDPMRPSTCGLNPLMTGGYSIAFGFEAVRASIVGIAP